MPVPLRLDDPLIPSSPPSPRGVALQRTRAELKRQGQELKELRRSHEDLSRRFTALEEQSEVAIKKLMGSLTGLERRIESVTTQGQAILDRSRSAQALVTRQAQDLRALALKSSIDKVTAIVNTTQAAAFGQKGSILAENNLRLAANQLFWTFLDPVLRGLGVTNEPSPGVVEWLSPIGALLTGQVALGSRQHVRFVTGVATFDGTTLVVSESLRGRVADHVFTDLERRTDVPVTLMPLDPVPTGFFTARVDAGVVRVEAVASKINPKVRVGWLVDTGEDVG